MTRKSRVGLGFVLGALCMLGAVFGIKWLAAWAGREGIVIPHVIEGPHDAGAAREPPGPSGERQAPSAGSAEGQGVLDSPSASAKTAPAEGGAPATRTAARSNAPAGAASAALAAADAGAALPGESRRDAAVANALAADAAVGHEPRVRVAEEDDNEEALLGRVVPDASAIIGEDEAAAPPPAAARKEPRRPAPTPAPRAPPPPVLIRITSSPLGAVVRTKKQVLGRTPIAIRFNAGNTYQLTFVKAGYVTSSRLIAVAGGKPKSVSVPMKKAAAPRRTGLFRGR
jgi:hypothetical protein